MPAELANAAGCVANDGRFFIFGGYESGNSLPSSIQIYNVTNDTWSTLTPIGGSIADFWMSCATDSSTGIMYIAGGYNMGNRFYSYNVISNAIMDLSSNSLFNLHRHGFFVASNGNLYVFGGYDPSTSAVSAYSS